MNNPRKGSVTKTKTVTKGDVKITKSTTKTPGSGKSRSVAVEKPGYTSTRVNMGALGQATAFRRQIKKNK